MAIFLGFMSVVGTVFEFIGEKEEEGMKPPSSEVDLDHAEAVEAGGEVEEVVVIEAEEEEAQVEKRNAGDDRTKKSFL